MFKLRTYFQDANVDKFLKYKICYKKVDYVFWGQSAHKAESAPELYSNSGILSQTIKKRFQIYAMEHSKDSTW
jgi:hypothetical protein